MRDPLRLSLRFCSEPLLPAFGLLAILGLWLGFPNDFLEAPILVLLWPLAIVFMARLADSSQKAFLAGWLATACGAALALYWLALPVARVGGLPWPLAIACALLIAMLLAVQGGVFAALAWLAKNMPVWQKAIFLATGWYLLEYLFALALGFPWLTLAGALAQWPLLIQACDLFGAWLVGAIWLLAALLLVQGQLSPGLGGCCLLAFLLIYATWRLAATPLELNPEGADTINCLIVEGNVDQNQKWLPAFQQSTLERYLELTRAGLDRLSPEKPLLLWPETALPFFYEKNPALAHKLQAAVRSFACPLLFGAPGVEKKRQTGQELIFNRAFLLGPDGARLGHYDKQHLVLFGEYVPAWLKLDFLDALLQGVGVYNEGNDPGPLKYESLALGVLICYEGIFPWLAAQRVANGANILVDISNDGWFGETPAARQHLYLTTLRCVEQGRWLLRATNTGLSAVADSRGRLVTVGPMFRAGSLAARARLSSCSTIYAGFAPWLPFLACAVVIVVWFNWQRIKRNVPFE